MLTKIRERATGWLAWVIVILIAIPFALWGIQSYFEGPLGAPVATVNGEEIPIYAFQNEMAQQRRASNNPRELDTIEWRTAVVESMAVRRLINQYVRDNNYRLSDAALNARIRRDPSFNRDGEFDPELYQNLLRSGGFTPQGYEAGERQAALSEQLYVAIADSAFATDAEMTRFLALQSQVRNADYAVLSATRGDDTIAITDEEAEQYYNDNQAEFESRARMKADYLELSVDALAAEIEPSEEEITRVFEQNSERYKQAETRTASHILFAVNADAEEATREEVRLRAEEVLAQAQGGGDFSELAALHSDDPGSKDRGGDLGVVARGQMVPPFEDAVFDMAADEIRGPVETRFGYHIIKLTRLTEERLQSLDEAREEVEEEARRLQAEARFAELGEAFQNLVFEFPDDLQTAADELGLTVQQTDWFNEAGGDGVAAEAEVRRAAFSDEVRIDGLNSAAIELGFDRMVAVRTAEFEDARVRSFDEVREEVADTLRAQKSAEITRALVDQLTADLNGAQLTWDAMLAQQQLSAQQLNGKRADAPDDLGALSDAVFSHGNPQDGVAAYNSVVLENGDYAIYALREVTDGGGEVDEETSEFLREQVLLREGDGVYRRMRQAIWQEADVVINQSRVENPDAGLGQYRRPGELY